MAWTEVECRECGSKFDVQMYGPHKDREWRVEHLFWLCDECKTKKREEEAKKAAQESQEMELPELVGSEKQIQWALKIRLQAIKQIDETIEQGRNWFQIEQKRRFSLYHGESQLKTDNHKEKEIENDPEKIEKMLMHLGKQEILKETKASWWIDNRNMDWGIIARERGKKFKNSPEVTGNYLEAEAAKEAKAEATVRPTETVTENVAEIAYKNDKIEISFPEKREDFREVVKGLRFTWDSDKRTWTRRINKFNGPIKDRIAEAGNKTLSIGIPIRIFDEDIRKAAINADFQPEQTRWVAKNTNTGWFSISWNHKNEDFYSQARKLTGSRYDRDTRSVLVPPESFQEVLDFADMYGFCLSEKAQAVADKAREEKEKSLVADPAETKTIKKAKPKSKPEPLEVPKEETIDEELRDDD